LRIAKQCKIPLYIRENIFLLNNATNPRPSSCSFSTSSTN
jgi:hypothetical protein